MEYVTIEPGSRCITVTPSDTLTIAETTAGDPNGGIPFARKLRITGNGNVVLVTQGGDTRTYNGLTAGTIIDWVATRQVKLTGTTATLEAIY